MSKQKQAHKPKPTVAVDDTQTPREIAIAANFEANALEQKPDVWLVHKATSLTSIVVRRASDNLLARCRVRNAAKYRRGVPVSVVGTLATGLYEGKPPLVKHVEVAS